MDYKYKGNDGVWRGCNRHAIEHMLSFRKTNPKLPELEYECIALSEWITVDDYCATRVFKDSDVNDIANRVAFIEKTGRVRIEAYTTREDDSEKWLGVYKGSNYGADLETRRQCDEKLVEMGYKI